ncbi:MAG: hypothetical protein QXI84_08875 [Thermofilaceae archaeon]|uniref:hypothetical protein n=1 Tax=Thermofilum sp. TaxID=1961369 RepID=UPI00315FBCCE
MRTVYVRPEDMQRIIVLPNASLKSHLYALIELSEKHRDEYRQLVEKYASEFRKTNPVVRVRHYGILVRLGKEVFPKIIDKRATVEWDGKALRIVFDKEGVTPILSGNSVVLRVRTNVPEGEYKITELREENGKLIVTATR